MEEKFDQLYFICTVHSSVTALLDPILQRTDVSQTRLLEYQRGKSIIKTNLSLSSQKSIVYLQLAQPIRLLLTYTGTEFEDIRYQRGDGESTLLFITDWLIVYDFPYVAPEFSREKWMSVKFTLGLDFPNVRVVSLCN